MAASMDDSISLTFSTADEMSPVKEAGRQAEVEIQSMHKY
jgi:hypothetical protein